NLWRDTHQGEWTLTVRGWHGLRWQAATWQASIGENAMDHSMVRMLPANTVPKDGRFMKNPCLSLRDLTNPAALNPATIHGWISSTLLAWVKIFLSTPVTSRKAFLH